MQHKYNENEFLFRLLNLELIKNETEIRRYREEERVMLYLEAYKLFKRKLTCILLIGIFLIIAIPQISNALYIMPDYEEFQQRIDVFEKHNELLTDLCAERFWEDYKDILSEEEVKQIYIDYDHIYFEDGKLISIENTFPYISFDIIFGFYEQWQIYLIDLISYMQYIPIFVAVVFSGIFTYDKTCGMQEIMLSARNGRKKSTKAKVLLAFLMTNIMFLVVAIIASVHMFLFTQGRGWNTSIQLNILLRDSPLNMNFGILWLHTLFLSFMAVNSFLFITLSVSFLAKNPVVAMCVSLGVLFILRPDVVEAFVGNREIAGKIVSLTPYNIINTFDLARRMPVTVSGVTVQWIYLVEVIYVVLLTAGGIFFFLKLIKKHKYFAA